MFGSLGTGEILLIILFIVIFFGARKIPEIAKGLGSGIREFRKAARDIQEEAGKEDKHVEDKNPKPQ